MKFQLFSDFQSVVPSGERRKVSSILMLSRHNKKPSRYCREGFLLYNDFLLLVALGAVLCRKRFAALFVAGAAQLASIDIGHGDGIGSLFHLENGGVAIIALKTRFGMRVAAEYHFTALLKLHRLARANCKR